MIFKSDIYRVSKILKKTKAVGFKDLKTDDCLQFSIKLKDTTGASGGRHYALMIETILLAQDALSLKPIINTGQIIASNSQNKFLNNIENFELKKVKND